VRAALIPLVAVELLLVLAYLGTHTLARDANIASARQLADESLAQVSALAAGRVNDQLSGVRAATEQLALQTARLYAQPFDPALEPAGRYRLDPSGVVFYTPDDHGGGAGFYSGAVPVGELEQLKARHLARLDPILADLKASQPLVAALYLNTWDSYNRIYPFFDVISQYAPKMDIPSFNFYYEADAQHNPGRGAVWTDAYLDPAGQGWMASCIAPVYRPAPWQPEPTASDEDAAADFLEGVVGLDVTVQNIIDQVQRLEVPWQGYALLLDRSGAILALPTAGEADFGLAELTGHQYTEAVQQDTFKPDDFNVFKRVDTRVLGAHIATESKGLGTWTLQQRRQLVGWASIPETGWKLLVVVPEANLYAQANQLGARFNQLGLVMIAALVGFYAVFFLFLWRRAHRAAATLGEPIAQINAITRAIAGGDYRHQPPASTITELAEAGAAVTAMGYTLGEQADALSRAHTALERTNAFQQALIAALPTPVLVLDAEGRIRAGNPALAALLRRPLGSLPGVPLEALVNDQRLAALTGADAELEWPDAQGQPRHYLIHRSTLGSGEALWLMQDVSVLKQAEIELVKARDRALENLALKNEFLSAISHELRTPMNGVLGMVELLLEGALTGEQRMMAETVRDSAQALMALIGDILDFSALEHGEIRLEQQPFNLGAVLSGLERAYTPAARAKGLNLRVQCDPRIPERLLGDEQRLRQVLVKLLGNAVKFTETGMIWLEASLERDETRRAWVRLMVRDTGMGIAPDRLHRLFQPFTQLDGSLTRRHGGVGLGLSLARSLVEMMGGEIVVSSAPGTGTTFVFTLPLARAELEPAAPRPAAAAAPPPVTREAGVLILLAEDNPVNAKLARKVLEGAGYRVELAEDGLQALARFRAGGCDLVVMDIQMPNMDGIEATRAIRAEEAGSEQHIPILALTANASPEDQERYLAAGMDAFMAKPFQPQRLRDEVARLLATPATSS